MKKVIEGVDYKGVREIMKASYTISLTLRVQ